MESSVDARKLRRGSSEGPIPRNDDRRASDGYLTAFRTLLAFHIDLEWKICLVDKGGGFMISCVKFGEYVPGHTVVVSRYIVIRITIMRSDYLLLIRTCAMLELLICWSVN